MNTTLVISDSVGGHLGENVILVIAEDLQILVILEGLDDVQLLVHVLELSPRLHNIGNLGFTITDGVDRVSLKICDLKHFGC